jgi:hypothetical protein
MNRLLRFSSARLALAYFPLTGFVLALFAVPLWYAWRVNLSTFRPMSRVRPPTTTRYKGGDFAAWKQPALFAAELRAAFKSLP